MHTHTGHAFAMYCTLYPSTSPCTLAPGCSDLCADCTPPSPVMHTERCNPYEFVTEM